MEFSTSPTVEMHIVLDRLFRKAENRIPGFERRGQQVAMASAVFDALQKNASLIVEAPTGIGKTFAYLLPSIIMSLESQRKALVSTHTKTLQDQVLLKDIPILHAILDKPFTAVVLKGRRNYLCASRLASAIDAAGLLFTSDERRELDRIRKWYQVSPDGDIEHLEFSPSPAVWSAVCSAAGLCSPQTCGSACPYQRSRKRAKEAHLVVLNHSLFLQLLSRAEDDERLIYEDDFVVIDEAHTLEAAATGSIGMRLSSEYVMGILGRLYNARSRKGLVARGGTQIKESCLAARREAQDFFENVLRAAAHNDTTGRWAKETAIRSPHIIPDPFTPVLQRLVDDLKVFAESETIRATTIELEKVGVNITQFVGQSVAEWAYWIEREDSLPGACVLCSAPIDVGSLLRSRLFSGKTSVILTSATIGVDGSASYLSSRIGAEDLPFLHLDSPFKLSRQMRIAIAPDMPEPDHEAYSRELPSRILQAIRRTHGRALVLFTSASTMNATASLAAPELKNAGIPLHVQGARWSRSELLDRFREQTDSVLFGLESFWTGIDVPGEALQHVIITRLPFTVPTHPLAEARIAVVSQRGGNPFVEISLPEAVLKLRQGAGRLIRSSTDTGIVTILDSRIARKSYGGLFLRSLPHCPVEFILANGEILEQEADFG